MVEDYSRLLIMKQISIPLLKCLSSCQTTNQGYWAISQVIDEFHTVVIVDNLYSTMLYCIDTGYLQGWVLNRWAEFCVLKDEDEKIKCPLTFKGLFFIYCNN